MEPAVNDPRFTTSLAEQFSLERLRFALQQVIPAEMASHVDIEFLEDQFIMGIRALVHLEVLGERLGPQTATARASADFTMPDGWWQHWKQDHRTRWYARWIVRRWPIRMRSTTRWANVKIDIERFRTFPHSTI